MIKNKNKRLFIWRVYVITSLILIITYGTVNILKAEEFQAKQVLYISHQGSDQNPGSLSKPWKTFKHAASQVKAGDIVYVRAGTYKEAIEFEVSGNEKDGYITFKTYPKETVIIDGEDSDKEYLVRFVNVHYYVFDGFQLTGLESNSSNQYITGIKISGASSNINIQNNELYNIKNTAKGGNANGIVVYGDNVIPIEGIVIQNNFLHHLELGRSEALTIVGNVTNFEVIDNTIEHVNNIGIDIAGYYGTCKGNCIDQARNGIVAGNKVSYADTANNPSYSGEINAAGIYVDGGDNLILENNEVSYSNFGFSISSENKGGSAKGVILRNNIIHHNDKAGLVIGGSKTSNGGAYQNKILNNTFYLNAQSTKYPEISIQNNVKQNVFSNNLFISNREGHFLGENNTSNSDNKLDYNLYVELQGSTTKWELNDQSYSTFHSYQVNTKQDKHSSYMTAASFSFQEYINGKTSLPIHNKGSLADSSDVGLYDFNFNARVFNEKIDIGAIAVQEYKEAVEIKPSYIKVDGFVTEWFNINNLAKSKHFIDELKAIRIHNDLFVMINGKQLTRKGQLYLNIKARYATNTFFDTPYWGLGKANYMVEEGIIYEYKGDGKSWVWKERLNLNRQRIGFTNRQTAIEYSIPLDILLHEDSKDAVIKLGYAWAGSNFHRIPNTNDLVVVNHHDWRIYFNQEQEIKIDGLLNDWSVHNELHLNSSKDYRVYAKQQDNYIYFAIQGIEDIRKIQLYFDTDVNAKTGLRSSYWKNNGADYLLENETLYKHSDPEGKWNFKRLVSLENGLTYSKSSDVIEYRINLNDIAHVNKSQLSFAILLDDKDYVPQDGLYTKINVLPVLIKNNLK